MRLILALLLAFSTFLPAASFADANMTLADCSIASMSGSSQFLGTAYTLSARNLGRKYLMICNNGTTNNVGVNLTGGTAALAGAGTITLVPGSCLEYPKAGSGFGLVPSNAVTVIGTAAQPVLCLEGR